MIEYLFIASLFFNLTLFALAKRSMRTWRVAMPLALLCIALPVFYSIRIGLLVFVADFRLWWPGAMTLAWVAIPLLLFELVASMLQLPSESPENKATPPISNTIWVVRLAACITGIAPFFVVIMGPVLVNNQFAIGFGSIGTLWLIGVLGLYLTVLYQFERAWRGATPPQKRIMQVCFASILVIILAEGAVLVQCLLFHFVTRSYIETASIVGSLFSIGIPLSFLRYRLADEKISVSRDMVYSSVTLLVAGSVLLGLGLITYTVRSLGLSLSHTSTTLVISSVAFMVLLALTSRTMRKKVIRYVNQHFYHRKYDYRDMFYRLSATYRADDRVGESIGGFLEQLRYMLTVEEAFVFVRNTGSGNFKLFYNPEYFTSCDLSLSGTGAMASALAPQGVSLIPVNTLPELSSLSPGRGDDSVIKQLRISFLCPIRHGLELVGILGIRDKRACFDKEDLVLIKIFSESIGASIFRGRLVQEQIENKQFESFARIASFIIHDVKNQVSTLSLISRNAQTNITNPDFQKSMLASLMQCTTNLQSLIDRLDAPLRQEPSGLAPCDVNEVVAEVVKTSVGAAAPGVRVDIVNGSTAIAQIDRTALSNVVKNLVVNALEAMHYSGTLTVRTGAAKDLPEEVVLRINSGESIPASYKVYITVEDTGPGISADFIETSLFRPFSSTKDKGIGIGLYQCKLYIESAGGQLICRSQPGDGALFCILL